MKRHNKVYKFERQQHQVQENKVVRCGSHSSHGDAKCAEEYDISVAVNREILGTDAFQGEYALTTLEKAVVCGDAKLVKRLLDHKVDANYCGKQSAGQKTIFHLAAERGFGNIIEIVGAHMKAETELSGDANFRNNSNRKTLQQLINLKCNDPFPCVTPLQLAGLSRQPSVIGPLCKYGAVVNTRCPKTYWNALMFAADAGCGDTVSSLLENDADPRGFEAHNLGPVHIAAKSGHLSVLRALHDHSKKTGKPGEPYPKSLTQVKNVERMGPLHLAIEHCKLGAVDYLLRINMSALELDMRGRSPAAIAAEHDHPHMVTMIKLLLFHADRQNHLLLTNEITYEDMDGYMLPIHVAAYHSNVPVMKELLDESRRRNGPLRVWRMDMACARDKKGEKKVTGQRAGATSLHFAASSEKVDVCVEAVEFLLDQKANPNSKDLNGQTPLLRALVSHSKARSKTNDLDRKTAINDCCKRVVQVLLDGGADATLKDLKGVQPLVEAYRVSMFDSADLILMHLVKTNPEYIRSFENITAQNLASKGRFDSKNVSTNSGGEDGEADSCDGDEDEAAQEVVNNIKILEQETDLYAQKSTSPVEKPPGKKLLQFRPNKNTSGTPTSSDGPYANMPVIEYSSNSNGSGKTPTSSSHNNNKKKKNNNNNNHAKNGNNRKPVLRKRDYSRAAEPEEPEEAAHPREAPVLARDLSGADASNNWRAASSSNAVNSNSNHANRKIPPPIQTDDDHIPWADLVDSEEGDWQPSFSHPSSRQSSNRSKQDVSPAESIQKERTADKASSPMPTPDNASGKNAQSLNAEAPAFVPEFGVPQSTGTPRGEATGSCGSDVAPSQQKQQQLLEQLGGGGTQQANNQNFVNTLNQTVRQQQHAAGQVNTNGNPGMVNVLIPVLLHNGQPVLDQNGNPVMHPSAPVLPQNGSAGQNMQNNTNSNNNGAINVLQPQQFFTNNQQQFVQQNPNNNMVQQQFVSTSELNQQMGDHRGGKGAGKGNGKGLRQPLPPGKLPGKITPQQAQVYNQPQSHPVHPQKPAPLWTVAAMRELVQNAQSESGAKFAPGQKFNEFHKKGKKNKKKNRNSFISDNQSLTGFSVGNSSVQGSEGGSVQTGVSGQTGFSGYSAAYSTATAMVGNKGWMKSNHRRPKKWAPVRHDDPEAAEAKMRQRHQQQQYFLEQQRPGNFQPGSSIGDSESYIESESHEIFSPATNFATAMRPSPRRALGESSSASSNAPASSSSVRPALPLPPGKVKHRQGSFQSMDSSTSAPSSKQQRPSTIYKESSGDSELAAPAFLRHKSASEISTPREAEESSSAMRRKNRNKHRELDTSSLSGGELVLEDAPSVHVVRERTPQQFFLEEAPTQEKEMIEPLFRDRDVMQPLATVEEENEEVADKRSVQGSVQGCKSVQGSVQGPPTPQSVASVASLQPAMSPPAQERTPQAVVKQEPKPRNESSFGGPKVFELSPQRDSPPPERKSLDDMQPEEFLPSPPPKSVMAPMQKVEIQVPPEVALPTRTPPAPVPVQVEASGASSNSQGGKKGKKNKNKNKNARKQDQSVENESSNASSSAPVWRSLIDEDEDDQMLEQRSSIPMRTDFH